MWIRFACPRCGVPNRREASTADLNCTACDWSRAVPELHDAKPEECLVCGCGDLWRQKDFPQKVGLAMVAAGIVLSTIAVWYWQPVWALGILMFFGLADFLLFMFMPDVLVCYRCGARHSGIPLGDDGEAFDLGVAERYRQERIRRESAEHSRV